MKKIVPILYQLNLEQPPNQPGTYPSSEIPDCRPLMGGGHGNGSNPVHHSKTAES